MADVGNDEVNDEEIYEHESYGRAASSSSSILSRVATVASAVTKTSTARRIRTRLVCPCKCSFMPRDRGGTGRTGNKHKKVFADSASSANINNDDNVIHRAAPAGPLPQVNSIPVCRLIDATRQRSIATPCFCCHTSLALHRPPLAGSCFLVDSNVSAGASASSTTPTRGPRDLAPNTNPTSNRNLRINPPRRFPQHPSIRPAVWDWRHGDRRLNERVEALQARRQSNTGRHAA